MKPAARLPSRRLNEHDAALIKSLGAAGWLQSDIASLFGTHSGTVSTILAGGRFGRVAAADLASQAARADLAEVQAAWSLRMARLLSALLSRGGAIV
jgi:hypothetical protein